MLSERDLNDLRKDGRKAIEKEVKFAKRRINFILPDYLERLAEKLRNTNFDLEELLKLQIRISDYENNLQRDTLELQQLAKLLKELGE